MTNLPKVVLLVAVVWYAVGIVGLSAMGVVLVFRWLQGVVGGG